ncbi:MAG: ubiquitin carboxyl-terminal hydrolase [Puniceicoccales bacterium]|nr:ubiquitin carboxyl-terminal hydrolase [Puniceicoccales bacterium]
MSRKMALEPEKRKQQGWVEKVEGAAENFRIVRKFIPKKEMFGPERKKESGRVISFQNTVSLPQTWFPSLHSNLIIPNGLANFGASCYINNAIQILNSVPELRESIINSTSNYSFISGLRELLKNLNSVEGIQENRLRELLTNNILPALDNAEKKPFTLTEPNDIRGFLVACFNALEKIGEPVAQYFQFTISDTFYEKSSPENRLSCDRSTIMLDLPKELPPSELESKEEFVWALQNFDDPEEMSGDKQCVWKNGVKIDTIKLSRIASFPKVLLIDTLLGKIEGDFVVTENLRPMSLPLKFNFPQEVMVNPEVIRYKLIADVIYLRPSEQEGHFIFYLRDFDRDCFWECNDSKVRQMSNEEALEILKNKGHIAVYIMD